MRLEEAFGLPLTGFFEFSTEGALCLWHPGQLLSPTWQLSGPVVDGEGSRGKLELGRMPGGLLVSGRSGSLRMVESGQGCHSGYVNASL